jgi:predicted acylesterase/phospholipase RssA
MEKTNFNPSAAETNLKIGLALSGGGFRASIFHLGVIRRLEELGVMKNISVISAVSGGSIIAAYYVIEMERRLREKLVLIEQGKKTIDQLRMEAFERIATDFFAVLDHNLRCRAMVFSPFYHPLQWIKSLWPGYSRSNLMQAEYDRWLYHDNPLDQLPSVTERTINNQRLVFGPKLILNATSLIDGRGVSYSRIPIGRFEQFTKVDKNVLKLSQVVGASSAVPGVFPPVAIGGEKLVDGGVADNQGVEALLKEETGDCCDTTPKLEFDILLISDASGQLEQIDSIKDTAMPVLTRTMSVLQFQVRQKVIDLLVDWKKTRTDPQKEFAFVQLFLNLKDRPDVPRVPSEYISPLGRIRTDLDQFSPVEREALMYHGYTLIDAQIQRHCPILKTHIELNNPGVPMNCPPLFAQDNKTDADESTFSDRREQIKRELVLGAGSVLIIRSMKKNPWIIWPVFLLTWLLPLAAVYLMGVRTHMDRLIKYVGKPVLQYLQNLCPLWVQTLFSERLNFLRWPLTDEGATIVVCVGLAAYLFLFLSYTVIRIIARRLDWAKYQKLTGGKRPDISWEPLPLK